MTARRPCRTRPVASNQRAMIGAKLAGLKRGQRADLQAKNLDGFKKPSAAAVAEMLKVSVSSVAAAKAVLNPSHMPPLQPRAVAMFRFGRAGHPSAPDARVRAPQRLARASRPAHDRRWRCQRRECTSRTRPGTLAGLIATPGFRAWRSMSGARGNKAGRPARITPRDFCRVDSSRHQPVRWLWPSAAEGSERDASNFFRTERPSTDPRP
jgi:hypothetical protein